MDTYQFVQIALHKVRGRYSQIMIAFHLTILLDKVEIEEQVGRSSQFAHEILQL